MGGHPSKQASSHENKQASKQATIEEASRTYRQTNLGKQGGKSTNRQANKQHTEQAHMRITKAHVQASKYKRGKQTCREADRPTTGQASRLRGGGEAACGMGKRTEREALNFSFLFLPSIQYAYTGSIYSLSSLILKWAVLKLRGTSFGPELISCLQRLRF